MTSSLGNCVHFWDISELATDGGIWQGTCRKCHTTRTFEPVRLEDPKAIAIRPKVLVPY